MMNKKTMSILLTLMFVVSVTAQEKCLDVSKSSVKKSNGQVLVSFDVNVQRVGYNEKYMLTPVLFNKDDNVFLEPIVVKGKGMEITDRRTGALKAPNTYVIKGNKGFKHSYSVAVPFESWMDTVSLEVFQQKESCCDMADLGSITPIENKLLEYKPSPIYDTTKMGYQITELAKYDLDNPFLHPMEDYENRYDMLFKERERGTSKLFFKQGNAGIDQFYNSNGETLDAIAKAFEIIDADPRAKLKKVVLAGFSSPEGPYAVNYKLAENRVFSLKQALASRLKNTDPNVFEIYNGAEDWDGLRAIVDTSTMEMRQQILDVIDNNPSTDDVRDRKIIMLDGGKSYRFMLQNYFPGLRNAGYVQVYYEIDTTSTIYTSETEDEREAWVDLSTPENQDVTNINLGLESMSKGEYAEALGFFEKVKNSDKILNQIGVCHMMTGDLNAAKDCLQRAIDKGNADSAENLKQVEIMLNIIK